MPSFCCYYCLSIELRLISIMYIISFYDCLSLQKAKFSRYISNCRSILYQLNTILKCSQSCLSMISSLVLSPIYSAFLQNTSENKNEFSVLCKNYQSVLHDIENNHDYISLFFNSDLFYDRLSLVYPPRIIQSLGWSVL